MTDMTDITNKLYNLINIKHCFTTLKFQRDNIQHFHKSIQTKKETLSDNEETKKTFFKHWNDFFRIFEKLYHKYIPNEIVNLSDQEMLEYLSVKENIEKITNMSALYHHNKRFNELYSVMNQLFYKYLILIQEFDPNKNKLEFNGNKLTKRSKSWNNGLNEFNVPHSEDIACKIDKQTELCLSHSVSMYEDYLDSKNLIEQNAILRRCLMEKSKQLIYYENKFKASTDTTGKCLTEINSFDTKKSVKILEFAELFHSNKNDKLTLELLKFETNIIYGEIRKLENKLSNESQANKKSNLEISALKNLISVKSDQIDQLFNHNKELEFRLGSFNETFLEELETKLELILNELEKYIKDNLKLWNQYNSLDQNSYYSSSNTNIGKLENSTKKFQNLSILTNKILIILEIVVSNFKKVESVFIQTESDLSLGFCKVHKSNPNIYGSVSSEIGSSKEKLGPKSSPKVKVSSGDGKPKHRSNSFKRKLLPGQKPSKSNKNMSEEKLLDMVLTHTPKVSNNNICSFRRKFDKQFSMYDNSRLSSRMSYSKNNNNSNCTTSPYRRTKSEIRVYLTNINNQNYSSNIEVIQDLDKLKYYHNDFIHFTKLYIKLLKELKTIRIKLMDLMIQ